MCVRVSTGVGVNSLGSTMGWRAIQIRTCAEDSIQTSSPVDACYQLGVPIRSSWPRTTTGRLCLASQLEQAGKPWRAGVDSVCARCACKQMHAATSCLVGSVLCGAATAGRLHQTLKICQLDVPVHVANFRCCMSPCDHTSLQ